VRTTGLEELPDPLRPRGDATQRQRRPFGVEHQTVRKDAGVRRSSVGRRATSRSGTTPVPPLRAANFRTITTGKAHLACVLAPAREAAHEDPSSWPVAIP
jgi:hypothetical protein